MGLQNVAVGCINEGFLYKNVRPFCRAKKRGRNNEATVLPRWP